MSIQDPLLREFHIGDVLSITSEKLVSPRLMDGVYDILDYMTGENLFTHQLIRARKACAPYLLKQHPELAAETCDDVSPANWRERLAELVLKYGEFLAVEPLPHGSYIPIDPITEAEAMFGPERVIVVKGD